MTMTRMARLHLGICPKCRGNIGWGHLYIERNGTKFHTQCDPEKPAPQCWCGREVGRTETEHQECFLRRYDVTVFTRAMANIFSATVAKFPKFRA